MMKIAQFLAACFVTSLALQSYNAQACSMAPVDVKKQTQDLERFAITTLNIDSSNVTSVDVNNASGNYIWSDPMCPEGIKAEATFIVNFNNPSDPLTHGCTGIVKVSKTAPTGLSRISVKHTYTSEVLQAGSCLE